MLLSAGGEKGRLLSVGGEGGVVFSSPGEGEVWCHQGEGMEELVLLFTLAFIKAFSFSRGRC